MVLCSELFVKYSETLGNPWKMSVHDSQSRFLESVRRISDMLQGSILINAHALNQSVLSNFVSHGNVDKQEIHEQKGSFENENSFVRLFICGK